MEIVDRSITIKLSAEEAAWLHAFIQNPRVTVNEEGVDDRRMREDLFNATSNS